MSTEYEAFLASKSLVHVPTGIESPEPIHEALFPFQSAITSWALRRGRACIFAGTGLGKTPMQCEWARHVEAHTERPVLILAPLAVSHQTINEAKKLLGMEVKWAADQSEVGKRGVYITNYQKLEHFQPEPFGGVAADESSIIKNQDGHYRNAIIEAFQETPFRLACTASPSPNDLPEIGNHAEFMGSMTMEEMLSTFFVHDGGETQKWRLKGHAEMDFWRWMASWCVCIQKPSDIGYADDGYILPQLHIHEHVTASQAQAGQLFALAASTLQERRQARKQSIGGRVELMASLCNGNQNEQWAVWCNLNDESAALTKAINGAVEVKGGDSDEHKERAMLDFAAGKVRVLVSKPSICGYGMNFQNCHQTGFVGLSDSWEQYYQAVRRFWRFGQKNEVHAHIIISEAEGAVLANIKRKERDAQKMQASLVEHMSDLSKKELGGTMRTKLDYRPEKAMKVPAWLIENVDANPEF